MQITADKLIQKIRQHRPWHHNVQITDEVDVFSAFDESERVRANNNNVGMIDPRERFIKKANLIYPQGLGGKRFLDCACNAGGYCFWARELGAQRVHGFDVRPHWIDQAQLILKHRTVAPVDRISFEVCDLLQLPQKKLEPADFTLFKGIFYHLADPILGLKIAADMTREVLWINTARRFIENSDSLVCYFENTQAPMSGVHSLCWMPSGPRVMAKMLYWLGFVDIRHIFSHEYQDKPGFGRMEIMASRRKGMLDEIAREENAETMSIDHFEHAKVADVETKLML